MNKNNMFKKIPVIGITFLLLLATTPTMIGQTIQKENQTSNNSNIAYSGSGKPDFKIVDVKIGRSSGGWPYVLVYIENCGSGVSWNGECRFTIKRLFKNSNMYVRARGWGNKPHNSGTIEDLYMGSFIEIYGNRLPALFFARIFFEVDPNDTVDESNERNNRVWTYIFGVWTNFGYLAIYGIFLLGR